MALGRSRRKAWREPEEAIGFKKRILGNVLIPSHLTSQSDSLPFALP